MSIEEIKRIKETLKYYETTKTEPTYCEELITTGELKRIDEEIERQSKAQVILDNENAELNHIINKVREYIDEDKNCVPKHIKEYFKDLVDKAGETDVSKRDV